MLLKITDEQKKLIDEISAISGIGKEIVREVWEFTIIRWIEQVTKNPKGLNNFEIPFVGQLGVRYVGDTIEENGALSTNVDAFVSLHPSFRKLIGDTVDEGPSLVVDLLKKKIDNAVLTLSTD